MNYRTSSERMGDAVGGALRHWMYQREVGAGRTDTATPSLPPWTIALSRQAGVGASGIAQAIGERLGWPVYDRELIEKVAQDAGLHARLVESVDERNVSWLEECWKGFMSLPGISEAGYARRMTEVITTLGSIGGCVIVGRGAAHILPSATTLRVRLVAPLEDRVRMFSERVGVTAAEAARDVAEIDKQRLCYVRDHFHADAADPALYDLTLSTSRLGPAACADLIAGTMEQLKAATSKGACAFPASSRQA
jgi:cytidylate kinase